MQTFAETHTCSSSRHQKKTNLFRREPKMHTLGEDSKMLGRGCKEDMEMKLSTMYPTNNQPTLNKLPPEIRCRHFVYQSPTAHTNRCQVCKKKNPCVQRVHISTELPFCTPPLVVGYLHPLSLFSSMSAGVGALKEERGPKMQRGLNQGDCGRNAWENS